MERSMNMQELIKEAKNSAPNLMISELVEEFELFSTHLSQVEAMKGQDNDAYQTFIMKMNASHDRMTMEQFTSFVQDAKNFSPKDWMEIQEAKRTVAAAIGAQPPESKKKRMNKNIRINR